MLRHPVDRVYARWVARRRDGLESTATFEALIAQGVDTCFGVPGESYLAVLDGFHEHRERIRFIACRQEGGAAFMAEAQGKLSGRPGICFVTRGPGATNASIRPGGTVAVVGLGPIGLMAVEIAFALGAARVYAADWEKWSQVVRENDIRPG